MVAKLVLWSVKTIEVMFFAGLIGCVFTVFISWVSILKSSFSASESDED